MQRWRVANHEGITAQQTVLVLGPLCVSGHDLGSFTRHTTLASCRTILRRLLAAITRNKSECRCESAILIFGCINTEEKGVETIQ